MIVTFVSLVFLIPHGQALRLCTGVLVPVAGALARTVKGVGFDMSS